MEPLLPTVGPADSTGGHKFGETYCHAFVVFLCSVHSGPLPASALVPFAESLCGPDENSGMVADQSWY